MQSSKDDGGIHEWIKLKESNSQERRRIHAKLDLMASQEEDVGVIAINFVVERFRRLWVSKHCEIERNENNEDIRYRGIGQCTEER
jgi:hypothetical protein